jgi:DDE superfamily endonuclease
MNKYQFPPSRIWNLDETGMCPQGSRNGTSVVATKGLRANVVLLVLLDTARYDHLDTIIFSQLAHSFCITNINCNKASSDRTNVSALVAVNADGGWIPLFFIFPGKNICERFTHGAIEGSIFAASPSSYLNTTLFIKWFKWFVTHLPVERPVLLIMDGYKCHFHLLY